VVATVPPDQSGSFQVELWPVSNNAQVFPYTAYVQPPNLVDDLDPLPAFIRSDIVELGSIAEALVYRPKANPDYSESMCQSMAERFSRQFESELQYAMGADEGLLRQDIVKRAEMTPSVDIDMRTGRYCGVGGGGFINAMTCNSSYDGDDY
jgi:hypothetical protein